MATIRQVGEDCEVLLGGVVDLIKMCNAAKLANTLWDKEREKYTVEQMEEWGVLSKIKR